MRNFWRSRKPTNTKAAAKINSPPAITANDSDLKKAALFPDTRFWKGIEGKGLLCALLGQNTGERKKKRMHKLVKDKAFYKMLLGISVPIALQNLISFGVNLTDTVMLGSLGEVSISAVQQANQPFFIFTLLTVGLAGGATVLTSQYWGKGDVGAINKVFAIALKTAFVVSLAVTAAVLLFPAGVMRIFTNDAQVVEKGVGYLRIVAFSYFFYGITNTYLTTLRSVENVRISLGVYGTSFVINVACNAVFIFGLLGMPALGVRGAAIGTLVARICEFGMVLVYMLRFEKKLRFRLRLLRRLDRPLLRDYLQHSTPVVLNELFWGTGMSVHAMILGRLGAQVIAASTIANVVQQLTTVYIFGISHAAAVIVGKAIGAGREAYAKRCAVTLELLSIGVGAVSLAALLLLRGFAVSFYNVDAATKLLAGQMMVVLAFTVFFQSSSLPCIIGILRGGGDTRFGMALDLSFMWLFSIPLGLLCAFVWKLPVLVVYMALRCEEVCKFIICLFRLFSFKWVRNVTRGVADPQTE